MTQIAPERQHLNLPRWVPKAARNYIFHTVSGFSIRRLAKDAGCHASTVLRQIRRIEAMRDDLLVDGALTGFSLHGRRPANSEKTTNKDGNSMTKQIRFSSTVPDDATIEREGRRILRRLSEPAACLAVALDMEKAVVVREGAGGRTTRTAVIDRPVAQAMALRDWISCAEPGRISRYRITGAGRTALKKLLAAEDAARPGFAEAPAVFAGQNQSRDVHEPVTTGGQSGHRMRFSTAESPVAAMARRKDKFGNPFLNTDLMNAAERLREDFEVAQMGARTAQNWEQLLCGDESSDNDADATADGPSRARQRVAEALGDLGPGLGEVALRVCCFLEGLEAAEKRMGWSARSGKVVLRIALQRLKRHYDSKTGGAMIG